MSSGKFITFEGGEGTGKSTHVAGIAERLRDMGRSVLETREPGGTPEAEAIRALLVSGEAERWSGEAETLLNYAARDHHLNLVVRPALEAGTWVVCDRYMDSTRAYQGAAGGVETALIEFLEHEIVGPSVPDLTLVLDLDPETGLARAAERNATGEDRFEAKGLAFHRTLRAAFLQIASDNKERCVVIDAAKPLDEVAEVVRQTVVSRLSP